MYRRDTCFEEIAQRYFWRYKIQVISREGDTSTYRYRIQLGFVDEDAV